MAFIRVGVWTGVMSLASSGLAWGMDMGEAASLQDSMSSVLLAPVPTLIGLKVLAIAALLAIAVDRLRPTGVDQDG